MTSIQFLVLSEKSPKVARRNTEFVWSAKPGRQKLAGGFSASIIDSNRERPIESGCDSIDRSGMRSMVFNLSSLMQARVSSTLLSLSMAGVLLFPACATESDGAQQETGETSEDAQAESASKSSDSADDGEGSPSTTQSGASQGDGAEASEPDGGEEEQDENASTWGDEYDSGDEEDEGGGLMSPGACDTYCETAIDCQNPEEPRFEDLDECVSSCSGRYRNGVELGGDFCGLALEQLNTCVGNLSCGAYEAYLNELNQEPDPLSPNCGAQSAGVSVICPESVHDSAPEGSGDSGGESESGGGDESESGESGSEETSGDEGTGTDESESGSGESTTGEDGE